VDISHSFVGGGLMNWVWVKARLSVSLRICGICTVRSALCIGNALKGNFNDLHDASMKLSFGFEMKLVQTDGK
jgi:hypothetical protein